MLKVHGTRFEQNRVWDTPKLGKPQVKVVFTFDNLTLLEGCPFVCKVSENQKVGRKFFGVAYGLTREAGILKEWAVSNDFSEVKLLTYEGEFAEGRR